MDYLLTVLSSGRPVYLERTLASYAEFLNPAPSEVYVFDDGDQINPDEFPHFAGAEWEWDTAVVRLGQCAAQARCWQFAAYSEHEWVFHVEDDVVLLRPLDLRDLAFVIAASQDGDFNEAGRERTMLTQMALVRCPWGAEIEHGGYIPMFPGHYNRREADYADDRFEWIETQRNWANAPALFQTDLARAYPWPAEPGCETTIGPDLIAQDSATVFGLWGAGEPWCAHIGVERAPGSHGY